MVGGLVAGGTMVVVVHVPGWKRCMAMHMVTMYCTSGGGIIRPMVVVPVVPCICNDCPTGINVGTGHSSFSNHYTC